MGRVAEKDTKMGDVAMEQGRKLEAMNKGQKRGKGRKKSGRGHGKHGRY